MMKAPIHNFSQENFTHVGQWMLEGEKIQFVSHNDVLCQKSNVLIALLAGSHVKYVGRSIRSATEFLKDIRNAGESQETNYRLRPLIREILEVGESVEVHIRVENPDLTESELDAKKDKLNRKYLPQWKAL